MKVNLAHKELTVWSILVQVKFYVLGFVAVLVGLAMVLSKTHPPTKSLSKDYNYLYSVATSIKNGTEVNFPSLEKKLSAFNSLRPTFDPLFAKKYLDEEEFTKVESLLAAINERLAVKNNPVELFSKGSLSIERQNLQEAYSECKALKDLDILKEDYPFLYIYNQYRVSMIEELLDMHADAEQSKESLKAFFDGPVKEQVAMSPLLSLIQSDITNSK